MFLMLVLSLLPLCSIEFDRDCDYFAIAGVTKKIKVFEYGTVIQDAVDIHYPVNEMTCNSKIRCKTKFRRCLCYSVESIPSLALSFSYFCLYLHSPVVSAGAATIRTCLRAVTMREQLSSGTGSQGRDQKFIRYIIVFPQYTVHLRSVLILLALTCPSADEKSKDTPQCAGQGELQHQLLLSSTFLFLSLL